MAGEARGVSSPARRTSFAGAGVLYDASFGQFGERIAETFRICVVGPVRWPLKTKRIFNGFLRLVGSNHPGAGPRVVFTVSDLSNARLLAQLDNAASSR